MLFAVVEIHLHIGDRKSAIGAGRTSGLHALFHRWHEDTIHVVADQRLGEDHAAIRWERLDAHPNLGKLPRAAGLFLVAVFRFAAATDGGAVGNPRLDELHIHVEAALEFLGDDLELQPALAGNNGLPDLRLEVIIKRGILLAQCGESFAELVEIRLGLGDQRPAGVGRREFDDRQCDLAAGGAKRVAGAGGAKFHHRADIAGMQRRHRLAG